MARSKRGMPPTYRLHKPTGQAVVTVRGKDFYLGMFGSRESVAAYAAKIAEQRGAAMIATSDAKNPAGLSINELLLVYLDFARGYYVKGGNQTGTIHEIANAIKPMRSLYGLTAAADFGPLKLEAIRNAYVGQGWTRPTVNRRIGTLKRIFKWGVSRELIPAATYGALSALDGLRRGRTPAREPDGVKPVPDAFVDATKRHVSPQVAAMIDLQRLTGMRPGEVCQMRTRDVDTSGAVWVYRPESHKTEHHGKRRDILIGPAAQEVVRPWLRTELDAYLFSPAEADEQHRAELRERRKTRVQPSQQNRRVRRRRVGPGDSYDSTTYARAIRRGADMADRAAKLEQGMIQPATCATCGKTLPSDKYLRHHLKRVHNVESAPLPDGKPEAKPKEEVRVVPRWHPNQLRHNFATRARREFGLETTRVLLGHASAVTSEIYAERDMEQAARIVAKIG